MNNFHRASKTQQQQTRFAYADQSCQELASLVPTSGRAVNSLIGERAVLAATHVGGCCAVLARAARGWACLVCPEPHVVSNPFGAYSPEKYQRGERMRRAVAVMDGKCAECGKPVCKENRRLCARHRLMASARKRKAREVNNRAVLESIYGEHGRSFENGTATIAK